jgi:hypothetical protein
MGIKYSDTLILDKITHLTKKLMQLNKANLEKITKLSINSSVCSRLLEYISCNCTPYLLVGRREAERRKKRKWTEIEIGFS